MSPCPLVSLLCRGRSLQRVASMRLQDCLSCDNLALVFRGALVAADMNICSECLNLFIDELPTTAGVVSLTSGPKPEGGDASKGDGKKSKSGGGAGGAKGAQGRGKGAAEGKQEERRKDGDGGGGGGRGKEKPGGGVSAGAGSTDDSPPPAGAALERDLKDLLELLRSFISRVMLASAPAPA